MKTNYLFASAAVAAVLVITAPAHAQILGGAVRGGAGGALAGSFDAVGGMASTSGRMGAGSDTSLHGNLPARHTTESGAQDAAKVGAHTSDAATAAVRAGRDNGAAVAQAAMTSTNTANATSATVGSTQQASRPESSAPSRDHAPPRSGNSGRQSAPGTQRAENPHPVATQADASTSASAQASASASTSQ